MIRGGLADTPCDIPLISENPLASPPRLFLFKVQSDKLRITPVLNLRGVFLCIKGERL